MPYADKEKRLQYMRKYRREWNREKFGFKARVPFPESFWRRVERGPQCWKWLGSFRNGYGQIEINYKTIGAHRVSYELQHGSIPLGFLVRHSCDNKWCVNPEHLSVGTPKDNTHDAMERGRLATGERHPFNINPALRPRGERHWKAKLTEDQARAIKSKRGSTIKSSVLAAQFCVSKSTIKAIWANRLWRWV